MTTPSTNLIAPSNTAGSASDHSRTLRRRPTLAALQHRQTLNALGQQSEEPQSVGEVLGSLMRQFPIPLQTMDNLGKAKAVQKLAAQANIPKRHDIKGALLAAQDGRVPSEWTKRRDSIIHASGSGYIFGLLGPRGRGKTQLAVQAMLANIGIGRSALYAKAYDFFMWIRHSFKCPDFSELDAVSDFLAPSLLVIDEMDVRGETAFEDNLLVYLIDKRYDAMFDTIVISNMIESEFRAAVGPSISDRLRETGGVVNCQWDSFRPSGGGAISQLLPAAANQP